MDKISWSDSLRTGVAEIDDHHRELIDIRNKLIDCCHDENVPHSEAFHNILAELFDYSRIHFSIEEDLMLAIGFPELDEHTREHHQFIEHVADLSIGVAKDSCIHTRALEFLTDWMVTHIFQADRRIRDFIECHHAC